jgi:hypothetical protein
LSVIVMLEFRTEFENVFLNGFTVLRV